MQITGFDWDSGNWPKCAKHGCTREDIEQVFLGKPTVLPDPNRLETRMRAIGKTNRARYIFVLFTIRQVKHQTQIRPISARFMHQKEIDHYEQEKAINATHFAQRYRS